MIQSICKVSKPHVLKSIKYAGATTNMYFKSAVCLRTGMPFDFVCLKKETSKQADSFISICRRAYVAKLKRILTKYR